MLIDFAITNYKSIKGTVHLDIVYNTTKTNEELDKDCNCDNYIDFFKAPIGNNAGRINVCPVMALFGANASGKSNILKAFLALRAIVLNGYTENFYTPFKFSSKTENAPTKFEITFSNDSEENPCIYKYGIEYSAGKIEREYLLKIGKTEDSTIFDTDDFDTIPKDMWQLFITRHRPCASIFFDEKYNGSNVSKELKEGFEDVKEFFNKLIIADDINLSPISVPTDEDDYKEKQLVFNTVKNWLLRMDMNFYDIDAKGNIINYAEENEEVSKFSFDHIEDIEKYKRILETKYPEELVTFEVIGDSYEFKKYNINMKYAKDGFTYKNGKDNTVPVNYVKDESTGTKNLFRFLFVLIDALLHGKIIIFDEIDRTIHTELLNFIFGVMQATNLNKHGAQMICSSHNPCIIETVGDQGTVFVKKMGDLSTRVDFLSEYSKNIPNYLSTLVNRLSEEYTKKETGDLSTIIDRLSEYTKHEKNVLKDYLNGRFGAIPHVRDVLETMEVPNAI